MQGIKYMMMRQNKGKKSIDEDRESKNTTQCYMFAFKFHQKTQWIDATTTVGHICHFINDAPEESPLCNARMKLEVFDGYPRLCLYSKRDIVPGEEIRYDYGDLSQNMFWREKREDQSLQKEYKTDDKDDDPFDLKKDVQTTQEVIDLNDHELELLLSHLAHDIKTHKQFYRHQDATLELAKVSRLLLAAEAGKLGDYSGKKLEDIDIEDDVYEEEDDEEVVADIENDIDMELTAKDFEKEDQKLEVSTPEKTENQ